jgi:hypothetical protein
MNTFLFGVYILIWPMLTLVLLAVLCRAVLKDIRDAKRNNDDMV